jgi:hypothetical protein
VCNLQRCYDVEELLQLFRPHSTVLDLRPCIFFNEGSRPIFITAATNYKVLTVPEILKVTTQFATIQQNHQNSNLRTTEGISNSSISDKEYTKGTSELQNMSSTS